MHTGILKPGTQTRHTCKSPQRTMHQYNHAQLVLSQGMFMYMRTLNQALKQGMASLLCTLKPGTQTRHTRQSVFMYVYMYMYIGILKLSIKF